MRAAILAGCLAFVLLVPQCHAQEATEASPRLLALARVMELGMDLELLARLAGMQLTDQQLQALGAVYAQNPVPALNLEAANQVVAKLAQLRQRMIKGERPDQVMADAMGIEAQMQVAFGSIFDRRPQQEVPDYQFTAQERLVWEILTPAQRGQVLGAGPGRSTARQVMGIIGNARQADPVAWADARKRLAACLSAGAGADGTPARENRRQMVLEFVDRVRGMTDADFAQQQEKLVTDLTTLLPSDADLAGAVFEYAPGYVHNGLMITLLHPRGAVLVQEMIAARARPAGQ